MADITQNGVLQRDDNDSPVMGGTSSVDNTTIINAAFDPVTRRLLTDAASGSFNLTVGDGVTTVTNVDTITFSGATVANLGAGDITVTVSAGTGDVTGPASSTADAVTRFNSTTGKIIKNSNLTLSDLGVLAPTANDGATLGSATLSFSDLFLASGAVVNYANGNVVLTHTSGVLTLGTGDLQITSAGSNAASVVTVGGTQTLTNKTLTTPVINGLATGTGVASAATASTIMTRDSNGLANVVNLNEGFTSTATAAGTTTLTVSSNYYQFFTGATTQTVTLPVATTLVNGQSWLIVNNSTGAVTVQTSGANTLIILAAGTSASVTCVNTAGGTGTASWSASYYGLATTSAKKLSVSNSLTLAGTDGTTMTFPSTSATIARTDAANTFTGVQTMTSPSITTSLTTASTSFDLVNTTATTLNIGGAATTLTIGGTPTTAATFNIATNATAAATTKTVNLGTGGAASSTSNINIGSSNGGTTTVNSPTISLGGTTGATTTGTIELGAASDTTLSRSSAGVLAVEGVVIPSISSTNTLTNKRVTPRVNADTSNSATPTLNTDNFDVSVITGQTNNITSMTTNLSGTPTNGQLLRIALTAASGTPTVTWGASFEDSTVTAPTSISTTRVDVGFVWNAATSKWRCIAKA